MYRSLCKAGMIVSGTLMTLGVGCKQPESNAPAPGSMPRYLGSGQTVELNATTYFAHGHLLERQGMFERAAEQYEKALAAQPNFESALNRLGVTLNKLARHAEASERFRQALELNPGQPYLYNNLGFSLYLEGEYAQAELTIAEALQIDPTFSRARMNHAIVLAKLNRFDDAFTELALVGSKADACFNMGLLLAESQRYEQAQEYFAAALDVDPQYAPAEEQLRHVQRLAAENDARSATALTPTEEPAMLRAGTPSLAAVTPQTQRPPRRTATQPPRRVQPTPSAITTSDAVSPGAMQAADTPTPTMANTKPTPPTMIPAQTAPTSNTPSTTPKTSNATAPTPAPAKVLMPSPAAQEMTPVPAKMTPAPAGTTPSTSESTTESSDAVGEMTLIEETTSEPTEATTASEQNAAASTAGTGIVELLVEIARVERVGDIAAAESLWCALEDLLYPERQAEALAVAQSDADDAITLVDARWDLMQRVLDVIIN